MQNLQNLVPSASTYAFGRRPNFLKQELRLWPNVKNTASVILWNTIKLTLNFHFDLQKCLAMCMDRYMDAFNIVSRSYTQRISQEQGMQ